MVNQAMHTASTWASWGLSMTWPNSSSSSDERVVASSSFSFHRRVEKIGIPSESYYHSLFLRQKVISISVPLKMSGH
jgi:tRNA(His) 5'-end guanylyltransferase